MLSMRMGKNNSWEPHSKGMTHAFILEFASQEHLDYYLLEDRVHAEFSREALHIPPYLLPTLVSLPMLDPRTLCIGL